MHRRVAEILARSGVPYRVHAHSDMPIPIRGPHDFAQALGYDVSRITKTLLLRATNQALFCLVVLPSDQRVALDTIARILDVKRVQMSSRDELAQLLDYPPTGVSPIGAGEIRVILDESMLRFPTVLIGAGAVGVEIEIAPQALQAITQGMTLRITAEG